MTINIFCKRSMKEEAERLEANGTLRQHVLEHIARFGKSATDTYNVKVSTSGMITVGAGERL